MNRDKLKTQDILVLVLAVITVAVCLLVLIPNFSQRNDMAAIVTAPPTPEPTPEPNPNEELSRAMLASMGIEEKIWQLFLATPESVTGVSPVTISGDGMQAGLESTPVGGLIYASDNIEDEAQLRDMLSGAQERSATALFLAYDKNAGSSHVSLAGNMRSLGFNLGLSDSESGLLYAAPYSDSMALDGLYAVIVSDDAVESDGGESAESESESGEAERTLPFFLSYDHVTGQLRGQDGWNGLILTPLLTGGVEGYSDGELAVGALLAGCDMICAPDDLAAAGQAILDAVNSGEIELSRLNESVQRILFAKLEAGILQPEAAEAESASESETASETAEETGTETTSETGEADDNAQSTRG